ncbi:hypothetical protein SEPCBS119000_004849 [Sporothrix epigloea]|uniref:Zn(2)-C6 fungal-type domain-containing protein n=1 Tax=Sporothrix epigloea TaxID=1892477 RepID=A0ABP0DUD3_9PEZI
MHSGGSGYARQHRPSMTSVSPIPPIPAVLSSPATPTQTPSLDFSSFSTSAVSQRKERGAIAAQACDTCRSRKQKCDEQRPKCGTCQKFKLDCHYRVPQPTKKDKTLSEILDRLKSVESKLDRLGRREGLDNVLLAPEISNFTPALASASHPVSTSSADDCYSSGVYQMLGWPVFQQLLAPVAAGQPQLNIKALASEQTAQTVVVGLHHTDQLPSDVLNIIPTGHGVPDMSIPLSGVPSMHVPSVSQPRRASSNTGAISGPNPHMHASGPGLYSHAPASLSLPHAPFPAASPSMMSMPTSVSSLYSWSTLFRLCSAYFDSFNYIAPIIDRQTFLTTTLPAFFNEDNMSSQHLPGSSHESAAALVFLVAALGDVAIANSQGTPVLGGVGSLGVKGGSVSHPPGLTLFNEARRRMGFVVGACSLEIVQIHALAGIYCSTCLRHMEYWRYTTAASLACQALIASKPDELTSLRADLVRLVFWYCLIVETHFNLELGLPKTGLDRFEDLVGLPSFSGPCSQDDYLANQASHFQEHFASQIVLLRLCVAFHASATSPSFSSSLPAAINQTASQLKDWHGMLPPDLRWQEGSPADFPNTEPPAGTGLDMGSTMTADLDLDLDLTASPDEVMYSNSGIFVPPPVIPNPSSSVLFPSTVGSNSSPSTSHTASGASSIPAPIPIKPPPVSQFSVSSAPPAIAGTSATMFTADLDAIPVSYPFALDLQVALLRSRYYYIKFLVYKPCLYKVLHATQSEDSITEEDAAGTAHLTSV